MLANARTIFIIWASPFRYKICLIYFYHQDLNWFAVVLWDKTIKETRLFGHHKNQDTQVCEVELLVNKLVLRCPVFFSFGAMVHLFKKMLKFLCYFSFFLSHAEK